MFGTRRKRSGDLDHVEAMLRKIRRVGERAEQGQPIVDRFFQTERVSGVPCADLAEEIVDIFRILSVKARRLHEIRDEENRPEKPVHTWEVKMRESAAVYVDADDRARDGTYLAFYRDGEVVGIFSNVEYIRRKDQ